MKFKCVVFYVNGLFILGISGLNSFDVNRIIFADSDNHNISKVRITSGLHAKLSPIHQQQILNDVQQHQLRHDASQKNHIITVPNQSEDTTVGSSNYPSFVKYRVDQNSNRSKKPVISNVNHYNQSNSNHPTTPPQLDSSTVNYSPSTVGSSLFRKFTPEESEIFLKAIAAHQVKFIEPKNSQKTTINPIKENNNDKYSKVLLSSSENQRQTHQHKINLDSIENSDDNVDDIQKNESELIKIQRESSKSNNIITPDKLILNKLNQKIIPTLNNKKLEYIEKSIDQNQSDKKVTFVILEEQFDGTFHIQGVKSSTDKKDSNDVKSIIDKIKKGEIDFVQPKESSISMAKSMNHSILTMIKPLTNKTTTINLNTLTKSQDNEYVGSSKSSFVSSTTPNYQYDNYVTSASTTSSNYYKNLESIKSTTIKPMTPSYIFLPKNYSPSSIKLDSTITESVTVINTAINNDADNLDFNNIKNKNSNYLSNQYSSNTMENLLKANGFFSMAKYLLQSGLNSVLNETGPYTVFIPSDRAFDKLLIHLGGAEKAEQKFKENPRLLSGLLLHHAIPGAFDTDSLQDEMTGVSLAGTQLRVNVYNKDDGDSTNKITTINGAKIVSTKQNIQLPQGVAHEMDRVMFPLPIGDLMQTLAADREQRFGQFLKMLHTSGLDKILTGTRTYTIFAPVDKYFESNVGHNKTSFRSRNLKEIISRHILPTTLYTAGISHYREMNTILPRFTLRIWKDDGQITVNDAVVINRNIPATNGVIHAIDSIL